MIPALASPCRSSPHRSHLSFLVRRVGPVLLALALALLAAGCAARAAASARTGPAPAPDPGYRVVLPAEGASSLKVGIPLGSRDVRTGRISVVVEWSTAATECAIFLSPRVACREGHGRPTTEGEAAGVLVPSDQTHLLQAAGEPGRLQLKPYVLELRRDAHHGSGEILTLEFTRDPEVPGDTCSSDLTITAVRFGTGTEMARQAMSVLRDDRSRPVSGVSKVRTATIRPR